MLDTIKVVRLAKSDFFFPVYEDENGVVTSVSPNPGTARRSRTISRSSRATATFSRGPVDPDLVAHIQALADENIARYGLLEDELVDAARGELS